MDILADILLLVGALGLAAHCLVLSRRLRALARSDEGLGATIETLSQRVDALTRTAARATEEAEAAAARLATLTREAERREGELSFLLAGLGEEGDEADAPDTPPPGAVPRFERPPAALRGVGAAS